LSSFALDFAPDGSTLAISTQNGEWKNFSGYSYLVAESYALELRDSQTLETAEVSECAGRIDANSLVERQPENCRDWQRHLGLSARCRERTVD
jgi:hypothetical protein